MDSPDRPPGPTKKPIMAEPALKLARINTNDKKTLAGTLATGLTENTAIVPDPKVEPAELIAGAKAVSDQEVILAAAEANVTTQRDILTQKIGALEVLMTRSVAHSTFVVEGDPMKMGMLKIPMKSGPTTAPTAGPPQHFFVTQGDHTTEVDGQCDKVPRASLYRVERAASPNGPWTTGYEGKRSSFTIAGLTPGEIGWFRMAAFVGEEWTDWSDPATCRVL